MFAVVGCRPRATSGGGGVVGVLPAARTTAASDRAAGGCETPLARVPEWTDIRLITARSG